MNLSTGSRVSADSGSTLTLGKLVKSGGAGSVYLLPGEPELVAKIYHDGVDLALYEKKLQAMLRLAPDLPDWNEGGRRLTQIAWPKAIVRDSSKRFRGYLMPRLQLDDTIELEYMLQERQARAHALPTGLGAKITLAANLCTLIAELHRQKLFVVDLKPINLRFYRANLYVTLLDCDGFALHGETGSFSAPQYTPDYLAPEFHKSGLKAGAEEQQDRFALAVIVFQLLNFGIHPYAGKPKNAKVPTDLPGRIGKNHYAYGLTPHAGIDPSPVSGHQQFPEELRHLFDRAFGIDPRVRPSAAEWAQALKPYALKSAGQLVVCQNNPEHQHFAGKECAACARDGLLAQALSAQQAKSPPQAPAAPATKKKRKGRKPKATAAVPPAPAVQPAPPPQPTIKVTQKPFSIPFIPVPPPTIPQGNLGAGGWSPQQVLITPSVPFGKASPNKAKTFAAWFALAIVSVVILLMLIDAISIALKLPAKDKSPSAVVEFNAVQSSKHMQQALLAALAGNSPELERNLGELRSAAENPPSVSISQRIKAWESFNKYKQIPESPTKPEEEYFHLERAYSANPYNIHISKEFGRVQIIYFGSNLWEYGTPLPAKDGWEDEMATGWLNTQNTFRLLTQLEPDDFSHWYGLGLACFAARNLSCAEGGFAVSAYLRAIKESSASRSRHERLKSTEDIFSGHFKEQLEILKARGEKHGLRLRGKKVPPDVLALAGKPLPEKATTATTTSTTTSTTQTGSSESAQKPLPARNYKPGRVFKDCSDCPEMVEIPAGKFSMGERYLEERFPGDWDETPLHEVRIKKFAIGRTEVTQGQWRTVMGKSPTYFTYCGDQCPVGMVSRDDALEFIKKLNAKTKQNYRLPSEAEWEYAARAGSITLWSFGNKESRFEEFGNIRQVPKPVARRKPNAFGLFDMHGNVAEWVEDCWHKNYSGAPKDGSAWVTNCSIKDQWVLRGGDWGSSPKTARSAVRFYSSREEYGSGFRLARSLP